MPVVPDHPFKYLWVAIFDDRVIKQPMDDQYSKHDPKAEYNPSSFRDFLDYFDQHPGRLKSFELRGPSGQLNSVYQVMFDNPKRPRIELWRVRENTRQVLHEATEDLEITQPIYFRRMEMDIQTGERKLLHYGLGYQGQNAKGKNVQKIIRVV